MEAHELARWTRFAAKGGIGKCTAIVDCVAEEVGEDLMFLKGDEITVLMQLPEPGIYLGHCEDVVGRFSGKDVRFHGKLKKPVMAKRGSVGVGGSGGETRMSISLVERSNSGGELTLAGERVRYASESPSGSRPGSRAKGTPSPSQIHAQGQMQAQSQSQSRTHAPMQSYATSYSQFGDDQSTTLAPDSRGHSMKAGHAKSPGMATSISGASVYSMTSVYSEASTATSVYSDAASRIGSMYSIASDETEREGIGGVEHGSVGTLGKHGLGLSVSVSVPDMAATTPSISTSDTMISTSGSTSTATSTSTPPSSTSEASFTSTLTSSPDSFEVVGSVSELEAKEFDMSQFHSELTATTTPTTTTTTGFTLVPAPLALGEGKGTMSLGSSIPPSPVVAPLRLGKSPRMTPSPGLPPASPVPPSPVPPVSPLVPRMPGLLSPGVPGSLSPGVPGSLSPGLPGSLSPGVHGSLSPGLPGSLAPGQRSPGLPGSLSPGFQYTFSSGSTSPNPNGNPNISVSARTNARTPPVSSSGTGPGTGQGQGQPYTAPLSPPPSSPLPPLPAGSLPSPAFPMTGLPAPSVGGLPAPGTSGGGSAPGIGAAASAAVSGRTSPLAALSAGLPSSSFPILSGKGKNDEEPGPGMGRERGRGAGEDDAGEGEEGNSTRLSTLDAFRRRMENDDDDGEEEDEEEEVEGQGMRYGEHSDEEGEAVLRTGGLIVRGENGRVDASGKRAGEGEVEVDEVGDAGRDEEEEGHSDGEVGIGLSLMAALGGEDDDDDEEEQVRASGATAIHANDKASESGTTAAMQWTRYTPTSPLSPTSPRSQGTNGRRPSDAEEEEEEDDGAYWDDIYDDYRYSRYSLASKRMSVLSKASGASKASSKSRANHDAPPMPVPPDRPSVDARRPSIGSDGTNGYTRPSVESMLSPTSGSRPQFGRSESEESYSSANSTQTLSSQFPAVPVHVPLRTDSKLKIIHDGYTQADNDHTENGGRVLQGSMAKGSAGIEVAIESVSEDDSQGQELDIVRQFPSLNTAISPLLHTTFGSPHSSRFTDAEDVSDHGHGRNRSQGSGVGTTESFRSPVEGPPLSPIEGGGMASALRAKVEAERAPLFSTAITLSPPAPREEPSVRAIVVDDEEGHPVGATLAANDSFASTSTESTVTVTPLISSQTIGAPSTEQKLSEPDPSSFLRPRPANQAPHPFARTSMFLPHPNAPKVTHQSQGPMYGRTITQPSSYPAHPGPGTANSTHPPPPPPNTTWFSSQIFHQLRHASIAAYQQGGPARRPPGTVFARCQTDLSTSMGPVPILFSLDPLPPLPTQAPGLQVQGGLINANLPQNMMPTRAATVSAPVRRSEESGKPRESTGDPAGLRLPRRSATALASGAAQPSGGAALPIPREGFVPQVGGARPRSRSFSAFGPESPGPVLPQRSREEPVMRMQDATSASAPSSPKDFVPPALMSRHVPSPLSLHSSTNDRERDPKDGNAPSVMSSPTIPPPMPSPNTLFKPPPSPLSQSVTNSPQLEDASPVASPSLVASSPFAQDSDKEKDVSPVSPSPASSGTPTGRTSVSSSNPRGATSPQSPQQSWVPVRHSSLNAIPRKSSSDEPPRQSSDSGSSHSLASPPPIAETFLQSSRSSPLAQEVTLKNKLSLPALKAKANVRSKVDDAISVASLAVSGENETIQVQDMDFELVKPSIPQLTGRASQDSTFTSEGGKYDASPLAADSASMHSPAPKSPLVPSNPPPAPPEPAGESADAHRQRELKWMALFPTVPPSQARKNKKVRKLLQEGVPSSVRYLVWCHLTDSKARALPGVYTKLGKKTRVSAFSEIERDATECFPDQTQLHGATGPIASLLQAYLSMVPDIQYSSGLTCISGHLLLLAPEEDAFWIFASMMDAHLRPYFSTINTQIEIDASLFSKALEIADPALTKKLYMQLSIPPASITHPWFSTLFVGTLPVDHLHRVWDIFLYEGIPYLFRIGLVLVNCVRHLLLQSTSEEAALAHLVHPPSSCLPSASELLILAANVKLKDDDVRKQRIKMEQQLKRTTQARPPNGVTNVLTSTISRPKP